MNRYSGKGTHEVGVYLSSIMGDLEYEIRRPASDDVELWPAMVILASMGSAMPCTRVETDCQI